MCHAKFTMHWIAVEWNETEKNPNVYAKKELKEKSDVERKKNGTRLPIYIDGFGWWTWFFPHFFHYVLKLFTLFLSKLNNSHTTPFDYSFHSAPMHQRLLHFTKYLQTKIHFSFLRSSRHFMSGEPDFPSTFFSYIFMWRIDFNEYVYGSDIIFYFISFSAHRLFRIIFLFRWKNGVHLFHGFNSTVWLVGFCGNILISILKRISEFQGKNPHIWIA